ncbi:MAG TPA: alpha/beta hydrolase [Micropepsaceae bacterium]|nr:alpha/beta hydrolase [Micropepsaceae bacterium]
MTVLAAETTGPVEVSGVAIEMTARGKGRPLVFLHPGHPSGRLDPAAPVLELLAKNARVLAPTHPGFGSAPAPRNLTTIDDLAYLYLDLLDALDIRDAVLVGAQLGGFIAAEMAVKSTAHISHLVLADAFGIKAGDRETRDIADIYAITDKHLAELVWADPKKMMRDTKALPESELVLIARSRESTGRYAWSPFMHDPKLKQRLHRVRVPTLVLWGARDQVAKPDYGRAYAAAIPGAKFQLIDDAGSFPHLEQPEAFAQAIDEFIR